MTGKIERFVGIDGRTKIIADGPDASLNVMVDMLRNGGAKSVAMSWSSPLVPASDGDAPPGVPVTWACTVTFHGDRHPKTVGTHGPTAVHARGMLLALADVLEQLGATVALTGPVPDTLENLQP